MAAIEADLSQVEVQAAVELAVLNLGEARAATVVETLKLGEPKREEIEAAGWGTAQDAAVQGLAVLAAAAADKAVWVLEPAAVQAAVAL